MAERARVLVTYASRMGSTQEIAETIGREGRSLCGQRV
jgi:menaquinone-dependent protoporphyrinogen IX oxidase